jgi:hypothetical protein
MSIENLDQLRLDHKKAVDCSQYSIALVTGDGNMRMKITSLSRPNEQRKVENLLVKLAKLKPVSAEPIPIVNRTSVLRRA